MAEWITVGKADEIAEGDATAFDVNGEQATIASIVKGDTVSEVLSHVQFDDRELIERLQEAVEQAVQAGRVDNEQAGKVIRYYERALGGYTYLSR